MSESKTEVSTTPLETKKAPLPTPNTDPDFQAVSEKVAAQGDKEQKHESSRSATKKAEEASVEPENKKRSLAEVKQVDKIQAKDTPAFDTSSFVQRLMAKIIAITPKSEEEADNFKDENKVHEVKAIASEQVAQKKTTSVGPLETVAKETPNESGITSKTVTPLAKAPIGPKPKDLGIEKAMPKKKASAEVEQPIQQNSQELEQQFQENEITDEQLANSNEPTFTNALETKNTAQEDSKTAPKQLRTAEEQSLLETKSGAKQQGKDDLVAMHQDRANILTNVQGEQEEASNNYTAEEAKVATKINSIYQSTKTSVESALSGLDGKVNQLFNQGAAKAQSRFETYVARRMASYKAERYEGAIDGSITWLYDAFAGLPDEVNAFFVEGRHLYIETMKQVIQDIADLVAQELTAAKQQVQAGRQEVADYVESLPEHLRKAGQATAATINRDFDELNTKVDSKEEELINSLAEKYTKNVAQIDSRIEEMKTANRGLIDIALDSVSGVIGTILEIKNSLMGILSAATEAIGAIILDPIGFLGNLIDGVGQGISNFMTKIDDYLTTGFVEWLTGAMSGAGIQMPEDIFSLEGIFSITTQALGMTWDFIRARAVGILGEGPVETIEESFEVFQVLRTEGMGGAWEYIKEQFGDLQETIMGSITGMLISEVVESGVKYLLALLTPAGAFVKAAMMIVDVAQFFIRQGSQLLELVDAFVQSVSAISTGAVGKVAEMIERAMSLSVPVLIGFFTSLLGLGDLAAKVTKIFKKITGRITETIDGFIEKAGAWFKDKKGRRKERKDKKKKEKEDKNKSDSEKDKDSKDDKDKRTDKQKKSDLKQGMKLGAAVVNNEQLNQDQIKVELNKLELKYRLDDLGAKLLQETAEWHVFMLDARLDGKRKSQEIKRKPTKAEDEEQVSEEDRKLHQRIAAEVKAQLEAKGKSTEGVETFEEFYALLQSEAVMLQKKYQPKLRDGIKIAVDLVNAVQQDKKDGDVDVKVRIAPNETTTIFSCVLEIDDNEVQLLQKVKDSRDYIFTSLYMNSLASYDDDKDRPGMRPRYIAFQKQLDQFINDIDSEVGSLEKDDKDTLITYDKKMQILRKVKEITEDLITINNAREKRSKLQTLSEEEGKEIGNRNIAFGLHSDILWKKETLLKSAQFISISGKDNLPSQGVKEGQKISKHSVDKLGAARDAAKRYSDILLLVPSSLGKKSPDPFTGKNDAKGNEINPKGDARGVQDAERRVFVYFHKNVVSKLETKLNEEQDLAKEKNTVTGTVSLYSQMTPCDFCSGASQVLKREFNSIEIEIESGVNYHL